MITPVEPVYPGMIPANKYAQKYNVNNSTVHTWARGGKLKSKRSGGLYLHVEDVPPPKRVKAEVFRGDKKRCPDCEMWKALDEYSASRRDIPGGICRPCNSLRERIRTGGGNTPEAISYKQEVVAQREVMEAKAIRRMAERTARIEAHAGRIKAMGLQGDGEGWADGEGS